MWVLFVEGRAQMSMLTFRNLHIVLRILLARIPNFLHSVTCTGQEFMYFTQSLEDFLFFLVVPPTALLNHLPCSHVAINAFLGKASQVLLAESNTDILICLSNNLCFRHLVQAQHSLVESPFCVDPAYIFPAKIIEYIYVFLCSVSCKCVCSLLILLVLSPSWMGYIIDFMHFFKSQSPIPSLLSKIVV